MPPSRGHRCASLSGRSPRPNCSRSRRPTRAKIGFIKSGHARARKAITYSRDVLKGVLPAFAAALVNASPRLLVCSSNSLN